MTKPFPGMFVTVYVTIYDDSPVDGINFCRYPDSVEIPYNPSPSTCWKYAEERLRGRHPTAHFLMSCPDHPKLRFNESVLVLGGTEKRVAHETPEQTIARHKRAMSRLAHAIKAMADE